MKWCVALIIVCLASAAEAGATLEVARTEVRAGHAIHVQVSVPRAMTVRLESEPRGSSLPTIVHFTAAGRADSVPIYVLDDSLNRVMTDAEAALTFAGRRDAGTSGPDSCVLGDAAFAPVAGWTPALSAAHRRTILLGGALIAIILLSATLIAHRVLKLLTFAVLAIGASAVAVWWDRAVLPETYERSGAVVVASRDAAQIDVWRYFTTRRASADVALALPGLSLPIFTDASHARTLHAELSIDASSYARTLHVKLHRGQRVAMLTRDVVENYRPAPARDGARSLMESVAREFYPGEIVNRSSSTDRDLGVVELAARRLE